MDLRNNKKEGNREEKTDSRIMFQLRLTTKNEALKENFNEYILFFFQNDG